MPEPAASQPALMPAVLSAAPPRAYGPVAWIGAALVMFMLGAITAWLFDARSSSSMECSLTGSSPLALDGCDLRGEDVSDASFVGAHMRDARLDGVDLRDADLRGARLQGATADGANMAGASLEGAEMQGASLRGVVLTDACLAGADMRGADLTGADLDGTRLDGADLAGAELTDARGLPGVEEAEPAEVNGAAADLKATGCRSG